MSLICLILGTALAVFLIVCLIKGQRYEALITNMEKDVPDPEAFPAKWLYIIGFSLATIRVKPMTGKLAESIRANVRLLFPIRYQEYYFRVMLAQAVSLGAVLSACCLLVGGMMPALAGLMLIVAVVTAVMPGWYFISQLNKKVAERRDACEMALPNAITKMALLANSGSTVEYAWQTVATENTGVLYDMMKDACTDIANGESFSEAVYECGCKTASEDVKKFTSALAQNADRGGDYLLQFLQDQAKDIWSHHRQVMLRKGEKAAGALMIPITMMFVGVIMIVMTAAMQNFG